MRRRNCKLWIQSHCCSSFVDKRLVYRNICNSDCKIDFLLRSLFVLFVWQFYEVCIHLLLFYWFLIFHFFIVLWRLLLGFIDQTHWIAWFDAVRRSERMTIRWLSHFHNYFIILMIRSILPLLSAYDTYNNTLSRLIIDFSLLLLSIMENRIFPEFLRLSSHIHSILSFPFIFHSF